MIPGVQNLYRYLLPFMPWAFSRLDLSEFDLVISSSHAFAKSVHVGPGATQICYCHTPPRYLWDLVKVYNPGLRGVLLGPLLRHLRQKDVEASQNVHSFIANSTYVAGRIARAYGRDARVIYPPVDVDEFTLTSDEPSYYLAGGRMVPYKHLDKAVRAANKGKLPLVIFGDGPERNRLSRIAGPTVKFVGSVSTSQLGELIHKARAFLFPGLEDFGILPVEVQAGGCPVIALAQGGALETVKSGETGLLYNEDSVEGLLNAIQLFEGKIFDPEVCRKNSLLFSRDRFEKEMTLAVSRILRRL
tara:strand:- start:800 stop:1705 length:906 start_codon:yes stop_codon:yes gene_type:complete